MDGSYSQQKVSRSMAFNSWLFVLAHDGYLLPFVVRTIVNLSGDIV